MTETEWLTSTDPQRMLLWFTGQAGDQTVPNWGRKISDRRLRLWACAICRQPEVWNGKECERCYGCGKVRYPDMEDEETDEHCPTCGGAGRVGGLTDPRSRRAVEVAERYADGRATEFELDQANGLAGCDREVSATGPCPVCAAYYASQLTLKPQRVIEICGVPPTTQATLLREIVGNPFRPQRLSRNGRLIKDVEKARASVVGCCNAHADNQSCDCLQLAGTVLPEWLTHADGLVPKLARVAYDERDWSILPQIADALEEAGCQDEAILRHLRGEERCWVCDEHGTVHTGGVPPYSRCGRCKGAKHVTLRGPHVRGCWVLDLLLGLN